MRLYLEVIKDENSFAKVEVNTEDQDTLKNKAKEIASVMGWDNYKVLLHKCRCDEGKTCELIEIE